MASRAFPPPLPSVGDYSFSPIHPLSPSSPQASLPNKRPGATCGRQMRSPKRQDSSPSGAGAAPESHGEDQDLAGSDEPGGPRAISIPDGSASSSRAATPAGSFGAGHLGTLPSPPSLLSRHVTSISIPKHANMDYVSESVESSMPGSPMKTEYMHLSEVEGSPTLRPAYADRDGDEKAAFDFDLERSPGQSPPATDQPGAVGSVAAGTTGDDVRRLSSILEQFDPYATKAPVDSDAQAETHGQASVGEAPLARTATNGSRELAVEASRRESVTRPTFIDVSSTRRASRDSGAATAPGAGTVPQSPMSMRSSLKVTTPGKPEPEPDLPFDFHRFLDQLRQHSAEPIAKYMKSFLTEFGRKQWAVHEQEKIVNDFLAFIAQKMLLYEPFKSVSPQEFDNALEGVEKLIMNKLYTQTFSLAVVAAATAAARSSGGNVDAALAVFRSTGHLEDVERDRLLEDKMKQYSWIREEHLGITLPSQVNTRRFLRLAQAELLKMDTFRAPRDKVICILNCCKVIFGLLRHANAGESADQFIPLLVFVVIRSKPPSIVSNIQYITRFRDPSKLDGEAGYYLSSLSAAVQFIENLDVTTLEISQEDYEHNMEESLREIRDQQSHEQDDGHSSAAAAAAIAAPDAAAAAAAANASSAGMPRLSLTPATKDFISKNSENALNALQRPLNSLGRMLSEQTSARDSSAGSYYSTSPSAFGTSQHGLENEYTEAQRLSADEEAARRASLRHIEHERQHQQERRETLATLVAMFPSVDREVVDMVMDAKGGRVGPCVDALLEMS